MSSNKEQASFSERLQKPVKQWIKSIFWCVVYILFVAWVGNYWWLLLLPFVFDAFITHFIPWSWWRNTKNRTVRAVMGWVDAIVFALIAVYFINLFLFQNYQIPTSSLEKSLMVGDFLLVSKASYGPRIPNTPLSLPLVQNTLPVFNSKSYFDNPQWEYRRLQGFDNIDRNDIVVFNFPTGDSVPLKVNVPDYYTICYEKGRELLGYDESIKAETCQAFGRSYVKRHPEEYGKVIWRPIDKRENYVKRCVGVPGDKLQIIDNQVYVNGKAQEKFAGIQFNYFVQTDGTPISEKLKDELGISNDDFIYFQSVNQTFAEAHGLIPNAPCYHFPLTQAMYEKLASLSFITKIVITKPTDFKPFDDVFPLGNNYGWSRDNYGPINIPAKGQTFELTLENLPVYERAISVYENNKLEVKDGKILINNEETRYYTFKLNYYWMMGDNRHNSLDSRYWGFVPEDHVVGRPVLVWLSLNKDKGWLNGKIRWNRFFKSAEQ